MKRVRARGSGNSNSNTVVTPCCGHGGDTAPCVRSSVVAKDAVKNVVAAIESSNNVNGIAMNAHTEAPTFCGHGGHTAPCVRSGVIAKDAVKRVVASIESSNSENARRLEEWHRIIQDVHFSFLFPFPSAALSRLSSLSFSFLFPFPTLTAFVLNWVGLDFK